MLLSKLKVLIGKPGLDGHDRGAKVVTAALREAGFEVIYTGRHKPVEEIADMAIREKVDVVGLSILSGTHLEVTKRLIEVLKERGYEAPVVVGGVIPDRDIPRLKEMGVREVFPVGSRLEDIVSFFNKLAEERRLKGG
ncbi:MAG: cobalamin B12-binding domain-containing protein [Candidatus Nezhaarchaeota archaeon]|nr:cobalamin B12-binding domain-containing protein [Candidatus Nezhaarchaeota archaeon]